MLTPIRPSFQLIEGGQADRSESSSESIQTGEQPKPLTEIDLRDAFQKLNQLEKVVRQVADDMEAAADCPIKGKDGEPVEADQPILLRQVADRLKHHLSTGVEMARNIEKSGLSSIEDE